jgi:hypothetical protein
MTIFSQWLLKNSLIPDFRSEYGVSCGLFVFPFGAEFMGKVCRDYFGNAISLTAKIIPQPSFVWQMETTRPRAVPNGTRATCAKYQ